MNNSRRPTTHLACTLSNTHAAWNNYYGRGRTPEREQEVDGQLLDASRSDSETRVEALL